MDQRTRKSKKTPGSKGSIESSIRPKSFRSIPTMPAPNDRKSNLDKSRATHKRMTKILNEPKLARENHADPDLGENHDADQGGSAHDPEALDVIEPKKLVLAGKIRPCPEMKQSNACKPAFMQEYSG